MGSGRRAHPPAVRGQWAGRDVPRSGPGGLQPCPFPSPRFRLPAPGAALGPWSVPGPPPPSRAAPGPGLPPPSSPGRAAPLQRLPVAAAPRSPAGSVPAQLGWASSVRARQQPPRPEVSGAVREAASCRLSSPALETLLSSPGDGVRLPASSGLGAGAGGKSGQGGVCRGEMGLKRRRARLGPRQLRTAPGWAFISGQRARGTAARGSLLLGKGSSPRGSNVLKDTWWTQV